MKNLSKLRGTTVFVGVLPCPAPERRQAHGSRTGMALSYHSHLRRCCAACIKHASAAHFHLVCTLSLRKNSCRHTLLCMSKSALLEGLTIAACPDVIKSEIIKMSRQAEWRGKLLSRTSGLQKSPESDTFLAAT